MVLKVERRARLRPCIAVGLKLIEHISRLSFVITGRVPVIPII
jgi:hypothetical protein